jgi:UDP-glucuronate 4-epimerase
MKKNILITGAAGFIGFHLAIALTNRGDNVIGLDNYNDYYTPQLKRDRANLMKKSGISILEGDICDEELLNKVVQEYQITHIAHLAAQAGVRYSIDNPKAYLKANIEGFLNILEICRQYPAIKLTYAFTVQDRTDQQVSFYGTTKKTNELMAYTYHHLYGIHATGLRFFTVYGPWGRPDMAYFSFTNAILKEEPIAIFNNGEMLRDFTYIDDIIQGTIGAVDLGSPHAIYNLGNNEPVKLLSFIEILEKSLGKKANKNFLPMQQGDVISTYAHIDDSRIDLNYSPKIKVEEGLSRFVTWHKEYFNH